MSVFPGTWEDAALGQNELARIQQRKFLGDLAADPIGAAHLARTISAWGDQAPTLPAGAIVGLAHAGVHPNSPVGQTVIQRGTSLLAKPSKYQLGLLPMMGPVGPQDFSSQFAQSGGTATTEGPRGITNPIGTPVQTDTESIYGPIGRGLARAREDVVAPVNRLIEHGTAKAPGGAPIARQEAGFANTDTAKGITREAGVVANTGLEALTIPLKAAAAGTANLTGNRDFTGPFGAHWHVGSLSEAVSPDQFPLYQQLAHGESLGQGWLPGGPATEKAVKAQQLAGNIDGHALSYGRVLANVVSPPGSLPYTAASGVIDLGVAMELDPTAALARELSTAGALKMGGPEATAKLFTASTDEAYGTAARYIINHADGPQVEDLRNTLRVDPGGDITDALIDHLKQDPGRAGQIVSDLGGDPRGLLKQIASDQSGIRAWLRPLVHQDSWLEASNRPGHLKAFQKIADTTSFTALRSALGDEIPVGTIAALAKTNDPNAVRGVINSLVETGAIPGPFDFKASRIPEALTDSGLGRMFATLPEHSVIDSTDANNVVLNMERTLAAANVPKARWDPILMEAASATNQAQMWHAWSESLANAVQDHVIGLNPHQVDAILEAKSPDQIVNLLPDVSPKDVQTLATTNSVETVRRIVAKTQGLPYDNAKRLTKLYNQAWREQHMFEVDQAGQPIRVAGLAADGEAAPIYGPFLENQLGRYLPPYDVKAMRQATTKWRQLLHVWDEGWVTDAEGFAGSASRKTHAALRAESYLAALVTRTFRITTHLGARLPLRILVESQARMAAAGLDSMFNGGIMDYAALVMGKRGGIDGLGTDIADYLGRGQSDVTRAIGRARKLAPSPFSSGQQIFKGYGTYARDDPNFIPAWVDELSRYHLDHATREVARAMHDPSYVPAGVEGDVSGLDAVKEWFSNGPGAVHLENLRDADLEWGSRYLNNRGSADAYLEELKQLVQTKTGGDPVLLDAVANGTPFDFHRAHLGIKKSVSGEFKKYLIDNRYDIGPEMAKGRAVAETGTGTGAVFQRGGEWVDRKLGNFLHAMIDTPSRVFSKAPAWNQFYWRHMQNQFDAGIVDAVAQEHLIGEAKSVGFKLKANATSGRLGIEEADAIAKARTLSSMHDMFLYPSETTNLEDMLRNVSPFSYVFLDTLEKWGRIVAQHPQVVRRVQQGVTQMQSPQGLFHKNQAGAETFTIPMPVKWLTGASGFDIGGPVKGLNMVGNGIPGLGWSVQWPAAAFIPRTSATVGLRKFISPYGAPDFSTIGVIAPGWLQKMQTANFEPLSQIPGVGSWAQGVATTVLPQTDRQRVSLEDLAKTALFTMVQSGAAERPETQADLDVLQQRAMQQAERLYFWRGLAQSVLPTAPNYDAMTKGPGVATAVFVRNIANDYHKLLVANNYDGYKSTLQFVDKWGPNVIYATEPQNLRTIYGLPTSIQGEMWQNAHGHFTRSYPNVWGFFAPKTGAFDQTVYHDQIDKGLIKELSVGQWVQEANQGLGNALYDQFRKKMGVSVSKNEQAALNTYKSQLRSAFPGYDTDIYGIPSKPRSEQVIRELVGEDGKSGALSDPLVARTPIARAARAYIDYRQQTLTANKRKSLSGVNMTRQRAALYQYGTQLVQAEPDFGAMWDSLFSHEVNDDG